MGVFKVDWALDAPIPWRADACRAAGTVHLGGTLAEIAASERDAWEGRVTERPFVLLTQPTLFDPTRAPAGKHIGVGVLPRAARDRPSTCCRASNSRSSGSRQGFRDRVLARRVMRPADLERHNANLVGGDIGAGVTDLRQFVARPTLRAYSTPVRGSVSVLGVDAARRRRPRDVRLPRGEARVERSSSRLTLG